MAVASELTNPPPPWNKGSKRAEYGRALLTEMLRGIKFSGISWQQHSEKGWISVTASGRKITVI